MSDKSGGDIMQGNSAMQGNVSAQDLNGIAAAGVGAVGGIGGSAVSGAFGSLGVAQSQSQGNVAASGQGGSDNISADKFISL
ncbi:hypothetical protein Q4485_17265 [Granulosicoccaceae sp. 1_MG-2023]|nr:hypothetical protein [Granulosicoccaceae sp. 1_MG-2023]